jgi:PhzF family phenazine biosynthesis protein
MPIKTYIIDAFTAVPFKGNAAGVCLLDTMIDATTMQNIASELNLSETAFLLQDKADENHFSIRYFTPTTEIAFCGHATLAASKLIFDRLGRSKIQLTTFHKLGLQATQEGDGIRMVFPVYESHTISHYPALYRAIGIESPLDCRFGKEIKLLLLEVSDLQALNAIKPDFAALRASTDDFLAVVVTAKSKDPDQDYYLRCFCPWLGIDEDPVTGSIQSVLAKYWADRLGKTELRAYQSSKRGGAMQIKVQTDHLEVTGQAQIIFEGTMNI